MKENMMKEIR